MKALWFFLMASLVPMGAAAEVYKCTEGGKTVYSAKPCAAGAAALTLPKGPTEEYLEREGAAEREREKAAEEYLQGQLKNANADRMRRAREQQALEKRRAEEMQKERARKNPPPPPYMGTPPVFLPPQQPPPYP